MDETSEIGKGSTFRVKLPLAAPRPERQRRAVPPAVAVPVGAVRGIRRLPAEDNAVNQQVARRMLADGDRQHCLESGMDDYLGKPVSQAALATVLERLLGSDGAAET